MQNRKSSVHLQYDNTHTYACAFICLCLFTFIIRWSNFQKRSVLSHTVFSQKIFSYSKILKDVLDQKKVFFTILSPKVVNSWCLGRKTNTGTDVCILNLSMIYSILIINRISIFFLNNLIFLIVTKFKYIKNVFKQSLLQTRSREQSLVETSHLGLLEETAKPEYLPVWTHLL